MNRLEFVTTNLKSQDKKAFVGYLMCGEFTHTQTVETMHTGVKNGLDIIELGFPFSDPSADGIRIQASAKKSLENGTKLQDVFAVVSDFRTNDINTPIILMGYYNIVMQYGEEKFLQNCKHNGVDALIIVDLPMEESENFEQLAAKYNIVFVQIVSTLTPKERFNQIQSKAKGFIYLVSTFGVTGQKKPMVERLSQYIANIKPVMPVYIGFGINSLDSAIEISKQSDGIIIGSHLIQILNEKGIEEFAAFVKDVRCGIDAK
jgi:tryptophan synthase alpha chain